MADSDSMNIRLQIDSDPIADAIDHALATAQVDRQKLVDEVSTEVAADVYAIVTAALADRLPPSAAGLPDGAIVQALDGAYVARLPQSDDAPKPPPEDPPPDPPEDPTPPGLPRSDLPDHLDDCTHRYTHQQAETTYPRLALTECKGSLWANPEQLAKWDVIGPKISSALAVKRIQAHRSDVQFFGQQSPRAYQGYNTQDPRSHAMGIPFAHLAPEATDARGGMWPGHWLYQAGTRTEDRIPPAEPGDETTIRVEQPQRLKVGRYACIYDAPGGSFANAEHVRIKWIDGDQVTLVRGYKSPARNHPPGSIIAEHDIGQGGDARNWAYNLSAVAPADRHGRTAADVMIDWIADMAEGRGVDGDLVPGARVDGVYFDVDNHFVHRSGRWDCNNDLIADGGLSADGQNLWGQGLADFYAVLRNALPEGMPIVGGARHTRGFEGLNGVQIEGYPTTSGGYKSPNPVYAGKTDGHQFLFQRYGIHDVYHQHAPVYNECLTKSPTAAYPRGHEGLTSNAPMRFAFGMTLLGGGHFAIENDPLDSDPWYDEFAVVVTAGSPRYGHALKRDDPSIQEHLHWLGRPLGPPTRIVPQHMREASTAMQWWGRNAGERWAQWTADNVQATGVPGRGYVIGGHIRYAADTHGAQVRSPAIDLEAGRDYTLCLRLVAAEMREVTIAFGSLTGPILVPRDPVNVVLTFRAEATRAEPIRINLGRESVPVTIERIALFEGDASVFRRDFERGVVVVNATPAARYVDLGEPLQRIRGTGQDPINDAAAVQSEPLDPWDAIVLVRPQP